MEKAKFQEALKGIIQHNRDTIPRISSPKCNECKLRDKWMCKKYPNGIPKEILHNEVVCKEFEEK